MDTTMSVAEQNFENVFVEDVAGPDKPGKVETVVLTVMTDRFDKYQAEKDVAAKRKLAAEAKKVREFYLGIKKERIEKRKLAVQRARAKFRSMTYSQKRDVAFKYKAKGYAMAACDMYLDKLDEKANAHKRAGVNDMDMVDNSIKSRHDSWEVDIEKERRRNEEERRKMEEENKRRWIALGYAFTMAATMAMPVEVQIDRNRGKGMTRPTFDAGRTYTERIDVST